MALPTSPGEELQRLAYLQELGIQTYFPRRPLPGARPSPAYAEVMLQAAEEQGIAPVSVTKLSAALPSVPGVESAHSAPRENEPGSAPIPLRAEADLTPAPVVSVATVPSAESEKLAAVEPAVLTEAVRFAFAYFPINEQLAVINELPSAGSVTVSTVVRQLLAAIVRALGIPCEEKNLSSMVFTWPFLETPGMGHDAQSARDTLEGFLARRLKLRPVPYLLILAEQSAPYLFPEDFTWQQAGDALHKHPRFDTSVLLTRSLHAMDAVPDIKREVWQALQPLRHALSNPDASPAADAPGNPQ